MVSINTHNLAALQAEVQRPSYDPDAVRVGIVHIGAGGFHRSHQAMYVDRLMNDGLALDWGICGVGLMPADARMRDVMAAQDCLYTLVLKGAGGARDARVIGSVREYMFAPDNPHAVIERMTDPAVRIVSMTVTEGGYNVSQVTGLFDATAPDVLHDLAYPGAPRTVFGLVIEALRRRRDRGIAPFTVMSCDNVQGNGDVARGAFAAFARLRDAELGEWVEASIAFPNSMVDRITPVTADEDRDELRERFGVDDGWPVVAEPFVQWVLEDYFPTGRPPFELAGVQLVDDVVPYELMKLRLLNSTHQGMCYFGYLMGYRYAHEAAADPLIADFLMGYMDLEATPTLRALPGVDLALYKRTLIERYRNPDVRDTLARLCADSSNRIPKWLVPVIREQLRRGGRIASSAAIVASWARYAEGVDEQGVPIEVVDQHRDALMARARTQAEHPTAFLEERSLFGDLIDQPEFVREYVRALAALQRDGAAATLAMLNAELPA